MKISNQEKLGFLALTLCDLRAFDGMLEGELTIGELAAIYSMSPSGIGGRVATLHRLGLVTRRRDPEDDRKVLIGLTEAGCKALADAISEVLTLKLS